MLFPKLQGPKDVSCCFSCWVNCFLSIVFVAWHEYRRTPLIDNCIAIHDIKAGGSMNPKLRPQGKAREAGLNNPSNLKIFGGTARGRRLDSPSVYLRPMMGKVREAVYSTLISFGLYDYPVRHLDCFSGSGSPRLLHCLIVGREPFQSCTRHSSKVRRSSA